MRKLSAILFIILFVVLLVPSPSWGQCTTSWTRNKDWGDKEVLTDDDLEAEFDRGYTFGTDCFDTSTGHDHDGTDSKQLDWDLAWADPVHDHSSTAEGGTVSNTGFTIHGVQIASGGVHASYLDIDAVRTENIEANAVDGTKIAIGSDAQGDILYYDGTDWVRLPAGTSGNFLKTQGAGANPAWATVTAGVTAKVGEVTRDTSLASGTQAVTGVGFQPVAIIFLSNENNTDETSFGVDDATTARAIVTDDAVTGGTWIGDNFSIYMREGSADTYTGTISSFDSDGFTISWTKTGSPTGTVSVMYLAIK